MKGKQIHLYIYQALLVTCICILPFSKWLSSFSIILMSANWLLEGEFKTKFSKLCRNLTPILMILFFLWSASGFFFTTRMDVFQFCIQKKLAFLALSIVLGSVSIFDKSTLRYFFYAYTVSLFVASIYCFSIAASQFGTDHLTGHFFYHSLGSPIDFNAIYFSVWIYIALFFIVTELISGKPNIVTRWLMLFVFCWLSVFLILLSSKLVIVIFLLSLLAMFVFNISRVKARQALLISGILILISTTGVLFTKNAVSKRFDEIRNQHISIYDSPHREYTSATYFNGLSLRLQLWEFGVEILNEKHAWLIGVSSGDSQALLNEKIVKAHMYTGEVGGENKGYLNYNFHNQFIETTVQSGIVGLLILFSLFASLFYSAVRNRDSFFVLFLIMFLCFFCTESVLEAQKGIIPFVLLALIFDSLYIRASDKKIT